LGKIACWLARPAIVVARVRPSKHLAQAIMMIIWAIMNIKEVAARARLSTATVSRTINQSDLVRPRTAEKVRRAIRELGYYPNTQARALVSGKSRMFGLIISDIVNPFFPELVKSFEFAAIHRGYEVIVANTDYNSERMGGCVRRMIERKVDGVAIMTSEIDRHLLDELSHRRLPIVFLDVGKLKPLISNINVDYSKGIAEAVQHIVAQGHERIAFISGPLTLKSARTRRSAFLKCVGKRAPTVIEGNHKIDGGDVAMMQLLALPKPPTAVLTSNDLTAIGALRAITRVGLRVPEDISVVGFDDIELSQFTQPPLTTIRLSRDELGRKAFDALYETVEGLQRTGQEIKVSTTLVLRESTGPVKAESSLRAS
jgi:DNA-binding LacI/PurR family transcriptional regulator